MDDDDTLPVAGSPIWGNLARWKLVLAVIAGALAVGIPLQTQLWNTAQDKARIEMRLTSAEAEIAALKVNNQQIAVGMQKIAESIGEVKGGMAVLLTRTPVRQ